MLISRNPLCSLLVLAFLLLSGCVGNVPYRPDYTLCHSADPINECKTSALQAYRHPDNPEEDYLLGIVEFDDQGQLHDRKQANAVLGTLNTIASKEDLLMIVFVHGWHHNASPGDDNITHFRESLLGVSRLEKMTANMEKRRPRKVVGVYVGWRGESLSVPWLNVLTFWGRKNTAEKVGHGGVTELFSRLEAIKNTKAAMQPDSQNRLVIIGHSFGGAVVYSALSQILMDRFVRTDAPDGVVGSVQSFGDLVVLINPAFEATQFSTLSDMANERRTYFQDQLPALAVLTSEADYATKYAFWIGRLFSTAFEDDRKITRFNYGSNTEQTIKQNSANRTAIGHFKPYRTHVLDPYESPVTLSDMRVLTDIRQAWETDSTHGDIHFPGTVLKHLNNSVSRNPYLIIKVDRHIIPGHNEIYDPRVQAFISHLIMLSTQAK